MQNTTRFVAVLAAILLPAVCFGQNYTSGSDANSFSLERWEEDYSYLKDRSARRDLFDPVKYIPLETSGENYLSFGGQARYRYDYFNNPNFGPGANDEDGFHLQRYLLHMDAHAGEHLRAFVQLDSSFVDGREGGGRYGDADHLDLQQAFVDLKTADDAELFASLRLGRQELIYGGQRLVSPDDWRNVRRSFDGAKLSISVPNDTVEFFLTRPVLIERDQFNNDDGGAVFAGVYNATALPDFIRNAHSKLELYLLALWQTSHSSYGFDADTYTLGSRFLTHPGPFDFEIEGDYQFGDAQSSDINAWSIATEAGYTFDSAAFTPRASVGLDVASGSPDVGGRFNQLFPPTYNYLGHLYLFGRSNLIDAHAGIDLHLTKDLGFVVAEHVFWRQNTGDALYNLANGVVRADDDSDAAYVGNEFDIALYWQIDRHVSGYIGWGHFFSGDFLQQTGPSKDVDFLYASMTYTF